MEPLVSVLMPAYNAAPYIAEAIESILLQTHARLELIIADDGSQDGTWDIIERYASRDSRIRAVRNPENLGITRNRNLLLSLAQGEFIAWQDADDISVPTRLELQASLLKDRPEVGIVGGYLEFFNDTQCYIRRYPTQDGELRKNIFQQSPVAQPVAMLRRQAIAKAGGFDEQLPQAEDLDLTFRIGAEWQLANVPEVLLHYRYHPTSTSNRKIRENISSTLKVRRRAATRYGYRMSLKDKLAFAATWATQLLPAKTTVWLFEKLRS